MTFRFLMFSFLVCLPIFLVQNCFAQSEHVFNGFDRIQFTSKGYYQKGNDTLTCVSAVKLKRLDSLATRIELEFEILDNWQLVDSSKYELVLEDSQEHTMIVNDRPLKALKYVSVNNEMAIYIEYPNLITYKNRSDQDVLQWQLMFLTVEFPTHLKRFSTIFEKYFYK